MKILFEEFLGMLEVPEWMKTKYLGMALPDARVLTETERDTMRQQMIEELPAYIDYILKLEIPEDIRQQTAQEYAMHDYLNSHKN
jgi:hypothetical protein